MYDGGARREGSNRVDHSLQVFVFDLDQRKGLDRRHLVLGCHGRHRLAYVEDLITGHHSAVSQGAGAEKDIGEVLAGYHSSHTR